MISASRAARFWALPPDERIQTCEAAAILGIVRLGVGAAPARWTAVLLRSASSPTAGGGEPDRVAAVSRAVTRVARHMPGSTCLMRALTAWLMLKRRSIPATLRFGVARADDKLSAHAWLEHAGRIVLGAESADGYTGFPPPP